MTHSSGGWRLLNKRVMGFLNRSRGRGGVQGVAVIRESHRPGTGAHWEDNQPDNPLDYVVEHFGSEPHRLLLEVRVPGRDPYTVDGEWKVPNRSLSAFGGHFSGADFLAEGLELPVRVDPEDPESVDIDWKAYKATPGRKKAQKQAQKAQEVRAGMRQAAQAWAALVRKGRMSRESFESNVQRCVDDGHMDPADAEAARASLD